MKRDGYEVEKCPDCGSEDGLVINRTGPDISKGGSVWKRYTRCLDCKAFTWLGLVGKKGD